MLLFFPEEEGLARRLAAATGLEAAPIERHRFPDGEIKLRLPERLPEKVVLLRGLDRPNEKLVELLLASAGLHEAGVRRVVLVAPYFPYLRQDKAFAPGEVASAFVVGRFVASCVEALVTVDPHLHRIARLDEAVPVTPALALCAAPLLGELAARERGRPLLVGPDEESRAWVEAAAHASGLEYAVGRKERRGDRDVAVTLPEGLNVRGRAAVVLDDVASTGRTLAQAVRALRSAGAATVDVAVTHALFVEDALETVRAAGAGAIWSTDTIAHPTNAVSVAPLIAQALAALLR